MSAIRDAIVATIKSVANIGVVQPYERYAKGMDQLKDFYQAPGLGLRGWFVRRVAVAERERILPRSNEYTRWRIQGVMAFDDANASELVFDGLIEALRDAFRANDTLNGTVTQCALPDGSEAGLQLIDCGPVMFAGVLCHGARLQLTTQRLL
ncbi:MAG: hypothetical protein AB1832_01195 [Pseudomonadota bacterium]